MTDRDALLRAFDSGAAVRPRYDAPQVVSLSRAVQTVAGSPVTWEDPVAAELARTLAGPDHLVVFLADGLGMNFVRDLPRDDPIRRHLHSEMQALFPTSTGPNVFAFSGARWPAEHGFLGWDIYLPSLGQVITPYRWHTAAAGMDLHALNVDARDVFRVSPFAATCTWDRLCVQPVQYGGSPATVVTCSSDHWCGAATLEEATNVVIERVRGATQSTLTYLYWPEPDGTAHRLGTGHPETHAAVASISAAFERLVDQLEGQARIVLFADHGHLDAPPAGRLRIDPEGALGSTLQLPPGGESRVGFLRVQPDAHDAFERAFAAELGHQFFLLTVDDVEDLRLCGPDPLSNETRARLGDYVAVSRGATTFEICRAGDEGRLLLAATHGGLTPSETWVPLVVV